MKETQDYDYHRACESTYDIISPSWSLGQSRAAIVATVLVFAVMSLALAAVVQFVITGADVDAYMSGPLFNMFALWASMLWYVVMLNLSVIRLRQAIGALTMHVRPSQESILSTIQAVKHVRRDLNTANDDQA